MSIIEVKDLKRSFRSLEKAEGFKETLKLIFNPKYVRREAVKGVSFEIVEGEFVGLIGANGAGKTTVLKILSGLIPATSGSVLVLGQNPFLRSNHFRKQIALVMGQKAQLWWDLPALEAFDLLRAVYDIPRDQYRSRVKQLTELLDVTKLMKTQIRRLSLGERMKMEVIGAILHFPKVVYLDEPTIGLDIVAAKNLRDFLKKYNEQDGATIILTSHNMEDISELCKRILLIKEGELVFDGSPGRLVRENECQVRIKLSKEITIPELSRSLSIQAHLIKPFEEEVNTFLIETERDQIPALLTIILSKHSLIDLGIQEPSLERVVQKIYQS